MHHIPTLFSLCMRTIISAIIQGNEHVQDILELPPKFFEDLVINLPPLALQNIHQVIADDCGRGLSTDSFNSGKKRGRYEVFNTAWKMLFQKRWPKHSKRICSVDYLTKEDGGRLCNLVNQSFDWQQLYWEKHLQDCLDGAAETALLPAFDGCIGELTVSDRIMDEIVHSGSKTHVFTKLSYHCSKFGHYTKYLKLQNVLCVAKLCELLKSCQLQSLVFRRIISKTQVNGVCMLLNQHRRTLVSLEFIHCQLDPDVINQFYSSLHEEGSETHDVKNLCIKSSAIFQSKSTLMPTGLLSFLSSGRSLESLCFSDTKMQPKFAKVIFYTLLASSSGLVTLEISDNNLAGWLSKEDGKSSAFSSFLGSETSLKSINVLNLRGNNLNKEDAEDLHFVLAHMPKLRSLDISDNPIMDDGIRSLFPYFTMAVEKACPLSDIKIDNCGLTGTAVAELLISLPTLKEPLNMLSIAENDLGSSIVAPLAKFLGSSGVRILNIEDIGLGTLGFQQFEDEVHQAMTLCSINISKNRGGIRTAYFISKVILHAPNLISINAGGNVMPSESLAVILEGLKQSHGKLELLDLTGNTQLYQSKEAARLLEFCHHRKPIVVIPSLPAPITPYDDDP